MPDSYAFFATLNADSSSSSFINIFSVKFVLTPLILQYSIAFASSLSSKLFAYARALNRFAPKYMQFAPFCTAALRHSKSPAGDKSSISDSIIFPLFFF